MAGPILYRKRLIPEECVLLKDDRLLYRDDQIIVTGWNTLKPRKDLHHGLSCYYLQEGMKVSRFYREDNSLLYWYCDIVDYDYNVKTDTYIITCTSSSVRTALSKSLISMNLSPHRKQVCSPMTCSKNHFST